MSEVWQQAFDDHHDMLWGLAYRMTGSHADADDIVQETMARLLATQPDTDRPLAPWLTRVTVNLARDRLRERKRHQVDYVGFWLPEPSPTAGFESFGTRWLLRESASIAFLVALEVLTPLQRAVLLLRDVFELDTRETAAVLEVGEANVRTTLHRARSAVRAERALQDHGSLGKQHRNAMIHLFSAVMAGDIEQVKTLLTEDVRSYQDAGGAYSAATRVVTGSDRVAQLLIGIARKRTDAWPNVEIVPLNGTVALLVHHSESATGPRIAPRTLMLVTTAPDGRIDGMYGVMNPDKLDALANKAP